MPHVIAMPWQGLYRQWAEALGTLAWCQWKLWDARVEVAGKLLGAFLDTPRDGDLSTPPPAEPPCTAGPEEIGRRAAECARKGLAPPPEIYEVQNRGRIDWSQFPDWARPSDPEMFEGGHEG